jgi:hypothetical protein
MRHSTVTEAGHFAGIAATDAALGAVVAAAGESLRSCRGPSRNAIVYLTN